jgi:hypothetical protein
MPEYRSRPASREELLAELGAFCTECTSRGHVYATLSYGWDSELEFDEMWKPHDMPIHEVLATVQEAEASGVVSVGAADVLVTISGVTLTLCHESDLHLNGDGPLFEAISARWQATGLEPSEVKPSGFKWPSKV